MPHARARAGRTTAAWVVAVASAALLGAGALLLGHAANAALIDVPSTGAPGRLVVAAEPYPAQFLHLSPGDPSYWQVAARLENAERATLSVQLRKDGALVQHPRGLVMTVTACDAPWTGLDTDPICPAGAREVAVGTPADDWATSSPTFVLRPLTPAAPEYLLVSLAVADSPAARADTTLMGLFGDMGVGLTAVAMDGVPVGPGGGDLPATGFDPTAIAAVAALAAGLLGLGSALRLGRKGMRR